MRTLTRAVAGALVGAGLFAQAANAEDQGRDRIREELVKKLEKKLEDLKNEMIREIDRALERREGRRPRPGNEIVPPKSAGGEDRPFLGVTLRPLSEGTRTLLGLSEGVGVMVDEVREGSPAAAAGVVKGDILLSWNGEEIKGEPSIGRLLTSAKPASKIELTILHRGKESTVEVTLAGRPADAEPPVAERAPATPDRAPRADRRDRLEDFLRRVLKPDQGEDEEPGEDEQPGEDDERPMPNMPFRFDGNPEQLEEMLKQLFSDPEQYEQFRKQAEEMMRRFMGEDGRPDWDQLRRMFEQPGQEEEGEEENEEPRSDEGPAPRESKDRLGKLLDEVLKGEKKTAPKSGEEAQPTEKPAAKAFLGVSIAPISPAVRTQLNLEEGVGVLLAGVMPETPAAQAGLEKFDVLVAIDGHAVADGAEGQAHEWLRTYLAARSPGDEISVKVLRDGKEMEFKVTLGSQTGAPK